MLHFLSIAGTALLVASASADIVWSGEKDVWLAINEFNPGYVLDLDLNEDSTTDFIIRWNLPDTFDFFVQPQLGMDGIINQVVLENRPPATIYQNWPLASGLLIGDSLSGKREWSDGRDRTLVEWMIGSDGIPRGLGTWGEPYGPINHLFMGLQFDAADGIHYGWAEMSVSNSMDAVVHSWAWETEPEKSILTGAVPEPSSAVLAVIGVMSVWVLRRQNRISNHRKE